MLTTVDEVKNRFERNGIAVAEWSRARGLDPAVVYALLNGRTTGKRGMAFLAAVALGLKEPPDELQRKDLEMK